MRKKSQYPSLEDLKNNFRVDEVEIIELFKSYSEYTLKEFGFRTLIFEKNDGKILKELFDKGLINSDNEKDFFHLLNIVLFTKIMLETKEYNYKEEISVSKKLQQKIDNLETTYKTLSELELLGVENSSLETIKKTKNELSKIILDLECIKDNVKEIKRNHILFLDYKIKPFNNILHKEIEYLKPYYKEANNDNDTIKEFSDDYKDYIQVLKNKTITEKDIIRLSCVVFIESLEYVFSFNESYNNKINFVCKVYNHFFNISESLIKNRISKLKYHSISLKFKSTKYRNIELKSKPRNKTKSITLIY